MPLEARVGIPPNAFVKVENGIPIPYYTPIPTAKMINDMVYASLADEYECRRTPDGDILPEDAKYQGWTCLEVMAARRTQLAAQGDFDSHKFVYERTLGKAVQQIQQTNVNISFSEAISTVRNSIMSKNPEKLQMYIEREKQYDVIDVTETVPVSLADLG